MEVAADPIGGGAAPGGSRLDRALRGFWDSSFDRLDTYGVRRAHPATWVTPMASRRYQTPKSRSAGAASWAASRRTQAVGPSPDLTTDASRRATSKTCSGYCGRATHTPCAACVTQAEYSVARSLTPSACSIPLRSWSAVAGEHLVSGIHEHVAARALPLATRDLQIRLRSMLNRLIGDWGG